MTTIILCVVMFVVLGILFIEFVRGAARMNRKEEMVYQDVPEVEFEEIESNQKVISF